MHHTFIPALCPSRQTLAYKKYQHVPLYLEWAPKDIFSTPPPSKTVEAPSSSKLPLKKDGSSSLKASAAKQDKGPGAQSGSKGGADGTERDEDGEGTAAAATTGATASIYVKNVAFSTGDAAFKKHFDRAVSSVGGTMRSAKVWAMMWMMHFRHMMSVKLPCRFSLLLSNCLTLPNWDIFTIFYIGCKEEER